jgi:hypothetical protein
MNLTQHVVSALAFSHYLFSFKIPCFLDPARAAISKKRREQLGHKRTWTLALPTVLIGGFVLMRDGVFGRDRGNRISAWILRVTDLLMLAFWAFVHIAQTITYAISIAN